MTYGACDFHVLSANLPLVGSWNKKILPPGAIPTNLPPDSHSRYQEASNVALGITETGFSKEQGEEERKERGEDGDKEDRDEERVELDEGEREIRRDSEKGSVLGGGV